MSAMRRLVVGISGATGVTYAIQILRASRELKVESHLVVSGPGEVTREYETSLSSAEMREDRIR
jgi:4-hydroxy-3-polyprenylbenzoate decarboxylase